jgi:hypothetical protein
MIILPNHDAPERIGSDNDRRHSEKFHAWHSPLAWEDAGGTPPAAGYSLAELKSGVYNEWCQWNGADIHLKGSFGGTRELDTVILGNPSFNYVKGFLYKNGEPVFDFKYAVWGTNGKEYAGTDGGKVIVFNRWPDGRPVERTAAPGEKELQRTDQKIVIIKLFPIECDGFGLEFIGNGPVSLNKIYFGKDTEMPLASAFSFPLYGRGQGGMTDTGVAYGTKYPPYRGLKATWDLADDSGRRIIEEYIMSVQSVDTHFIRPAAEDCYIPPMFVQLQTQDLENKKRQAGWLWEGVSLEWAEAR